jgi:tRNA threonylcarbamoyladenosine biosynthesis protein TsaE
MHEASRALPDEAATLDLGVRIAPCVKPGWLIGLQGDLGAGKTTFARGLLRALGHTGRVKSPTFTLIEQYRLSGMDIQHFDLYRFTDSREWQDAGFSEFIDGRSVCIIEWPQRLGGVALNYDLSIELEFSVGGRMAQMRFSERAAPCLTACLQ